MRFSPALGVAAVAIACLVWAPSSAREASAALCEPFICAEALNLRDFGADPTGARPSDAAWSAWLDAMRASGRRGYVPRGDYVFRDQLAIDLKGWDGRAASIDCEGVGLSILHVETVATSPQAVLRKSGGRPPDGQFSGLGPVEAHYARMKGCSIHGDTRAVAAGERVVFALGSADFSDQINEAEIDLAVSNADGEHADAVTTQLNSAYNGRFFFVSNGAGHGPNGVAVDVRMTAFSSIQGSFGNAGAALRLSAGFVYANSFLSLDLEEARRALVIESPNAVGNVFVGGQFSYSTAGVLANAGARNLLIAPNDAPAHGAAPRLLERQVGLTIVDGAAVAPEGGAARQHGPGPQRRDLAAGGSVFQDGVDPNGASFHTNFAPAGRDAHSVMAGGAFDFHIGDIVAQSFSARARTSAVNEQLRGNLVAAIEAGRGARCVVAETCHNTAGRIDVGAEPSASATIVFNAERPFATPPVCFAQNESRAVVMRVAAATATAVTFEAVDKLGSADRISYFCLGI